MDTITPSQRSENMRRIRSKGMRPELRVRHLLFQMGYRYRLHRKSLPGHPDIIFPGRRRVVFVHGCFWHQHKDSECKITRLPKSNQPYWLPKLERNVNRDANNQAELRSLGWRWLVVWECELNDERMVARKLKSFLGEPHIHNMRATPRSGSI